MNPITLNPIIYYSTIALSFIMFAGLGYYAYKYFKLFYSDVFIFIDKSDRWTMKFMPTRSKVKYQGGTYIPKSAILNDKGKALHIFSENNPAPMKITYKKTDWLDSKSLMSAINNELISLMVQPKMSQKDIFLIIGAIGGLIAGLASVLILLKQYGVI